MLTMQILAFIIGLLGAALVAIGTWLIYQPAGYITAGLLCLAWSWLAARSLAGKSRKGGN